MLAIHVPKGAIREKTRCFSASGDPGGKARGGEARGGGEREDSRGVGKARRGSEKGEARGEGERVGGERVREGEARGGRRDAQGSPKVITNSDAKSISKTGAKGRQEDKGNANKTHNKVDRTCICAGPH